MEFWKGFSGFFNSQTFGEFFAYLTMSFLLLIVAVAIASYMARKTFGSPE
jgi:hypothetical protein